MRRKTTAVYGAGRLRASAWKIPMAGSTNDDDHVHHHHPHWQCNNKFIGHGCVDQSKIYQTMMNNWTELHPLILALSHGPAKAIRIFWRLVLHLDWRFRLARRFSSCARFFLHHLASPSSWFLLHHSLILAPSLRMPLAFLSWSHFFFSHHTALATRLPHQLAYLVQGAAVIGGLLASSWGYLDDKDDGDKETGVQSLMPSPTNPELRPSIL